jgi:hypothetical protein
VGIIMKEEYWRTKDGQLIAVKDMDDNHLRSVLRMLIRKERERCDDAYSECDATSIDLY